MKSHVCDDIASFPLEKFHQLGMGKGSKLLVVGESPSPNGWIVSGKACYTPKGKLLATGKRLNELLESLGISVENCGFTELSKCIVEKRSELETCSEKCWPIFLEQLEAQDYKLIMLLGVLTTNTFSKLTDMTLEMGEVSVVQLNEKEYTVLPIFHPSPLNVSGQMKNKELFKRLYPQIQDLIK